MPWSPMTGSLIDVKFHEARRALGCLGRIVINDIMSVCPHTESIHVVLVDLVVINHPCTFAGFLAGFHSLRPETCRRNVIRGVGPQRKARAKSKTMANHAESGLPEPRFYLF